MSAAKGPSFVPPAPGSQETQFAAFRQSLPTRVSTESQSSFPYLGRTEDFVGKGIGSTIDGPVRLEIVPTPCYVIDGLVSQGFS